MTYHTTTFFFRIFLGLSLLLSACSKLQVPSPDPGEADFSRVVAIGDNYLTGYQDGALYYEGQQHSIPNLLAKQFELVGLDSAFTQPLMPDVNYYSGLGLSPKPWEGKLVSRSKLDYRLDCKGEEGIKPVKLFLSDDQAHVFLQRMPAGKVHNLSAPYSLLDDWDNPLFGKSYESGNNNPYYQRFSTNPGISTLLADAVAADATFMMVWAGMEEIYDYARNGGFQKTIPSAAVFENMLDNYLSQLVSTGAKGVIANIPPLESIPFFTTVPYNGANLTQGQADTLNDIYASGGLEHITFTEGENAFVIKDTLHPKTWRHLKEGEYILLTVPLDSMKCEQYGLLINVIHNRYSLTEQELLFIRSSINAYNQTIAKLAAKYNFAHVDAHDFFTRLLSGIKQDGVEYDANYISGGFFSLDGYHPNQKGYALLANEFILAINEKYNAVIPTVNCNSCRGVEFP